ncbi:MAG TPA: hypothetical protein VFC35_10540, partial [Gemmatimonadaceae bacterium]|nr:hypothetical protein [Gemmatimonadaceae bacterium]
ALNLEDWSGLADLCDPVSLRAFKREMLEDYGEEDAINEAIHELDPDYDPEIQEAIEHDVALIREWFNPLNRLRLEFSPVDTIEELREMDPGKMFARWLRAKQPDARFEHAPDEGEEWKGRKDRGSDKTTHTYCYTTIGSVLDGEKIAWVIYRNAKSPNDFYPGLMDDWESKLPDDEAELARETRYMRHPLVVTCRKQDDGSWRMIASSNFSLVGTLQVVEVRGE